VANVTVASINALGVFSSTGNLLITQAGTIGTGAITDGAVTNAKIADVDSSKLTGNVAAARITDALNASGSAPIYACRAWVNFDGVTTATIRASGNVSSVTRNQLGRYTINFATAMPDTNFSAVSDGYFTTGDGSGPVSVSLRRTAFTTTSVGVRCVNVSITAGSFEDPELVCVQVFR
jgi:hypothetical protein